ncbi:UDP-N-acetylmuramoyl-tripeptide--D-alanyl-D-alanine ligase family protein [Collimonas arenae]|uniref:UDP-N-acetylmuramoyl-tripeptide--D-alanyl-D-alanine ligase n=1 Tax=Collimonas arenae TaxID=279058 RepID=A0A127QNS9_9BURK|nr:UDP-N-acetylmuramoyl-tripeptide--D-alanyl-D-alanine ligase [Collimonas arenae]AMP01802.1 UDP-N-acetylmuramoyl-tripeptide--D-alanyl-D-alanine ligase family protein [Collimonas arenae]AMP11701.1 UDP-N-acetylmuramoyl-tripeptide--D-alanyl-D-alanine ligase family protein [Collimonas arenae]
MNTSLAQLQSWLGLAAVAGDDAQLKISGLSTDSRAVTSGDLFVALRGERFDAHDFLDQVIVKGAAAVLVERAPAGLSVPALVVPDTRAALGAIANRWRRQFALPLIAVTGSNGKTTVKEMIAAILVAAFGVDKALATRGNFNNEIGLPLTLLLLDAGHRAAVVELGMNHPGEIAVLTAIAEPAVALVNNAQREHQEFMASVAAVAAENGNVIRGLPASGIAVYPADDPYTDLWRSYAADKAGSITFGLSANADVSCSYAAAANGFGSELAVTAMTVAGVQKFVVQLAAAGEHNVRNALAAIACTLAIGVDIAAIKRGLESFAPVSGRLQRKLATVAGCRDALVIDDTYNANPDSVRAAIDVLAQANAPRLLVLGDMGEVGNEGRKFHQEIGAYAQQRGITQFFTLGDLAADASAAFGPQAKHFIDIAALLAALDAVMTPDTTVLIKGSRFMKMERAVQHLVGTTSEGTH